MFSIKQLVCLHTASTWDVRADPCMTLDKSNEDLGWAEGVAVCACWCHHPHCEDATAPWLTQVFTQLFQGIYKDVQGGEKEGYSHGQISFHILDIWDWQELQKQHKSDKNV